MEAETIEDIQVVQGLRIKPGRCRCSNKVSRLCEKLQFQRRLANILAKIDT